MEQRSLLRAIAHTPLRQPSPLQRYRATPGRHHVCGDVVLSSLGGEGAEDNTVFVLGPEDPLRVFALAEEFFGASAYAFAIEQDSAPAMPPELAARGWRLDEEEPAMVLTSIPAPPVSASGLRLELVSTQADFAAFGSLNPSSERWIPSLQAARDPDVALLVGYLPQGPVATSRLTRYGHVAEILGVTTLPEYRRQGFGTAMTWAAMSEAARRGCTALTLNASELGYGIYLRLGFVPAGNYLTYGKGP